MNFDFLRPDSFKKDKLPAFMEMLKVKRVFDLAQYDYPGEVFYKSPKGADEVKEVAKAVYICNCRIFKPVGEEVEILDIYKNSKADDPAYNLEHCNDGNIAILVPHMDYAGMFAYFTLNRLKKYAPQYHYEDRICFVRFDMWDNNGYFTKLLKQISIYRNGDFYPLTEGKSIFTDKHLRETFLTDITLESIRMQEEEALDLADFLKKCRIIKM